MSSPATVTVAGPAGPIECLVTHDPHVHSRAQGRADGPDDLPDGATVFVHGLASSVADDPRSVIREQVEMGVAVRMAVLDALGRRLRND